MPNLSTKSSIKPQDIANLKILFETIASDPTFRDPSTTESFSNTLETIVKAEINVIPSLFRSQWKAMAENQLLLQRPNPLAKELGQSFINFYAFKQRLTANKSSVDIENFTQINAKVKQLFMLILLDLAVEKGLTNHPDFFTMRQLIIEDPHRINDIPKETGINLFNALVQSCRPANMNGLALAVADKLAIKQSVSDENVTWSIKMMQQLQTYPQINLSSLSAPAEKATIETNVTTLPTASDPEIEAIAELETHNDPLHDEFNPIWTILDENLARLVKTTNDTLGIESDRAMQNVAQTVEQMGKQLNYPFSSLFSWQTQKHNSPDAHDDPKQETLSEEINPMWKRKPQENPMPMTSAQPLSNLQRVHSDAPTGVDKAKHLFNEQKRAKPNKVADLLANIIAADDQYLQQKKARFFVFNKTHNTMRKPIRQEQRKLLEKWQELFKETKQTKQAEVFAMHLITNLLLVLQNRITPIISVKSPGALQKALQKYLPIGIQADFSAFQMTEAQLNELKETLPTEKKQQLTQLLTETSQLLNININLIDQYHHPSS